MNDSALIKYYLDLSKSKEAVGPKIGIREASKDLSLVFSDDRDFIIQKKSGEQLIFMWPEFAIKDKKGGLRKATQIGISSFIGSESVPVNNNLVGMAKKESLKDLFSVYDYPPLRDYFEKHLASIDYFREVAGTISYGGPDDGIIKALKVLELDKEYYLWLAEHSPVQKGGLKYAEYFIMFCGMLYKISPEFALYFCNKYQTSSMQAVYKATVSKTDARYFLKNLFCNALRKILRDAWEKYGKAFVDYLCFDLYKQGFSEIPLDLFFNHAKEYPDDILSEDLGKHAEKLTNDTYKRLVYGTRRRLSSYNGSSAIRLYFPETSTEYINILGGFHIAIDFTPDLYSPLPFIIAKDRITNNPICAYYLNGYDASTVMCFSSIGKHVATKEQEKVGREIATRMGSKYL